jgi:alkylated DNA repair dioxygenase AlkB
MQAPVDKPSRLDRNLIDQEGELYFLPGFLDPPHADALLAKSQASLHWDQEFITIVGRTVAVPRLVAWHGDENAVYRYSGLTHYPRPWTPELLVLRDRIASLCGRPFNSVLGNWYRDGNDSMGWHADNEQVLGRDPWVASLSLGETRLFKIRHNRTKQTLDLRLAHGSLLVMGGSLQHHWRHCVPKSRSVMGQRINLTFRYVHPED